MKVVYVLGTYPCESETFIAREIGELKRQGLQVVVVAGGAERYGRGDADVVYRCGKFSVGALCAALKFWRVSGRRLCALVGLFVSLLWECPREAGVLLFNLGSLVSAARELESEGVVDLVHAGFLSRPAVLGMGLAVMLGSKFSVGCHSRDVFVESGAVRTKLGRCEFAVVCNGLAFGHLKEQAGRGLRDRVRLVRHGIEGSDVSAGVEGEGGGDIILAIGRFVEKKGFGRLIEAFAEVRRGRGSAQLWLVGDGPMRRQLMDMVEGLGVKEGVYFTGWQGGGMVRLLLECCSVLVVPSIVASDGDVDGVCNVLLEGCARGRPAVVSCFGGCCEVIEDGKSGRVVDPWDSVSLADAILEMLGDRVWAVEMAEKARDRVEREYCLNDNVGVLRRLMMGAVK